VVEVVLIGDSLMVDWRFYSLDMLPMNDTRGCKFEFSGRVSGWLLIVLASKVRSASSKDWVAGIQTSWDWFRDGAG
jgi:hypothetical protein